MLETQFNSLWLTGEISNLATPASGHSYFSLKDDKAQIRCVMFRRQKQGQKIKLENGMAIILSGTASLYETRGDFQVIVDYIEPAGEGELRRKYDVLKSKLAEEGLFDSDFKKSIPYFPKTIGVITSNHGAALHDILATFKKRLALSDILIYPASVQGQTAAAEISNQILSANKSNLCDVLILARGGGSLEDLWPFNEEKVVRSIADSKIPIITGIGHETDITLADFASDLRCATPTAAAEAAAEDSIGLIRKISNHERRLLFLINNTINLNEQIIDGLEARLRHPRDRLNSQRDILSSLASRLEQNIRNIISFNKSDLISRKYRLENKSPIINLSHLKEKVDHFEKAMTQISSRVICDKGNILSAVENHLYALDVKSTLKRGYSIVSASKNNKILKSVKSINIGEEITTQFYDGNAKANVFRKSKVDSSSSQESNKMLRKRNKKPTL